MKVPVSHNRVAELTVPQLFELLGRYLNNGKPVKSVMIEGKPVVNPSLVEVRWNEDVEEREL